MKTTFINENSEYNIVEKGKNYFNSRLKDLEFYSKIHYCGDLEELKEELRSGNYSFSEIKEALTIYDMLGSFYDYGLCLDFVDIGTFEDMKEGYYRYQLSYGGPSDEIRFYHDGTIEYVFLDWFCGVGFDVSNNSTMQWLENWFKDIMSIDWDSISLEQYMSVE